MSEWLETSLQEIALINPTERLAKGTKAKKVAMEFVLPFTKKISAFSLEEYKGGTKFRNGDSLVARITPSLENGKTSFVDFLDENEIGFGSTEFIVLREIEGLSDKEFLYYFACSPTFREVAIASMTGSSGRQRVQTDVVKEFVFLLPPLHEQRAIASVLSSLDDKIDLLHRQNKTLEALAQTLFRQWFVEEAEDDWEEVSLDSILTVKGGTTPSTRNPDFWDGEYYWTTPRDLSNCPHIFLFETARKITKSGLNQIGSGLLPKGTLLLSSRAPVGYLAFAEVPIAINQGYIAIIDDKGFSNYFIYFWIKENIEYIKSYAGGTTFLEISKSSFRNLVIHQPPVELRKQFKSIISSNLKKIRANVVQIHTLEKLRDTLLPKLMSGNVRLI
ncbi:MAG TPA: restriction endonuclease subunit S [Thermoplasmata archaeon]|nr:restriction endonuclease subunit S [Thermoplasmata archaeon]